MLLEITRFLLNLAKIPAHTHLTKISIFPFILEFWGARKNSAVGPLGWSASFAPPILSMPHRRRPTVKIVSVKRNVTFTPLWQVPICSCLTIMWVKKTKWGQLLSILARCNATSHSPTPAIQNQPNENSFKINNFLEIQMYLRSNVVFFISQCLYPK